MLNLKWRWGGFILFLFCFVFYLNFVGWQLCHFGGKVIKVNSLGGFTVDFYKLGGKVKMYNSSRGYSVFYPNKNNIFLLN